MAEHKKTTKKKPSLVHIHLNNIGWHKVRIILIETVECFNKEQLNQREQHYIDLLKPSLNKNSAYTYCPHNRQHSICVDCQGVGICEHNRIKYSCKECGGSQICEHNIRKYKCKICSPKYCEYCYITTSNNTHKRHTTTIKHIYNFIHS